MNVALRTETVEDYKAVDAVIRAAFKEMEISDQTEHLLVKRLRGSDAFIPELSIVAKIENEVVGHILLTKLLIRNEKENFESLALAPVSVHPDFQNNGIGSQLIRAAHQRAKALDYKSIILVGHENYYPRFGYELIKPYGIQLPFPVPDKNSMVIQLTPGALQGVSGMVEYPEAFFQ